MLAFDGVDDFVTKDSVHNGHFAVAFWAKAVNDDDVWKLYVDGIKIPGAALAADGKCHSITLIRHKKQA